MMNAIDARAFGGMVYVCIRKDGAHRLYGLDLPDAQGVVAALATAIKDAAAQRNRPVQRRSRVRTASGTAKARKRASGAGNAKGR